MANFKEIIQDFADHFGWDVEWGDGFASVDFEIESGETLTLFITDNDETVEFDVLSEYCYEDEEAIDHSVSTQMLMRNAELAVGAWVLEQLDDGWHFAVMYNEDVDTLKDMDYDELMANLDIILTEVQS